MLHRIADSLVSVTLFRIPELDMVEHAEVLSEQIDTQSADLEGPEGLFRKDVSDLCILEAEERTITEPPGARLVVDTVAVSDVKSRIDYILARVLCRPAVEESGTVVTFLDSPVERPECTVAGSKEDRGVGHTGEEYAGIDTLPFYVESETEVDFRSLVRVSHPAHLVVGVDDAIVVHIHILDIARADDTAESWLRKTRTEGVCIGAVVVLGHDEVIDGIESFRNIELLLVDTGACNPLVFLGWSKLI